MNRVDIVKDIIAAIKSTRSRAREAMVRGDIQAAGVLMLDVLTLEVCLVSDAEKLVEEIEKSKKAA